MGRSRARRRLKGRLATGMAKGRVLDHWQIEVTGAGWVWYLVDHETATIWVDYAARPIPRRPANVDAC